MPRRFTTRLAFLFLLLPFAMGGCPNVKDTTRLPPAEIRPLLTATLDELLAQLHAQAEAIQSVNAVTELVPSTGSAYSGVIEQYHDVRAFVLAERDESAGDHIRMIGQAPIVRRTVFDMVADLTGFRISIPPKGKFIVGSNRVVHRSDKPIENLRPQHLFEAFLPVPPLPATMASRHFLNENEFATRRYYAVTEVSAIDTGDANGPLRITRKWWFDRTDLSLVRVQRFDPAGSLVTDIHYAEWRAVGGTRYPFEIELVRPHDDYRIKLLIKDIKLNQSLGLEKFQLAQPPSSERIDLDALAEERKNADGNRQERAGPPGALPNKNDKRDR